MTPGIREKDVTKRRQGATVLLCGRVSRNRLLQQTAPLCRLLHVRAAAASRVGQTAVHNLLKTGRPTCQWDLYREQTVCCCLLRLHKASFTCRCSLHTETLPDEHKVRGSPLIYDNTVWVISSH